MVTGYKSKKIEILSRPGDLSNLNCLYQANNIQIVTYLAGNLQTVSHLTDELQIVSYLADNIQIVSYLAGEGRRLVLLQEEGVVVAPRLP